MVFRPFPVLTLIAIPALVALVWLGVWQAQRAGWKADLIVDFEQMSRAPPLPPATALCGDDDPVGRVVAPPVVTGNAIRVFGHHAGGAAGWRLFQVTLQPCGAVLVESGFEGLDIEAAPRAPEDPAPTERFLVEPWPDKPLMAGENSPAKNEWHWFDATLMAAAFAPQMGDGGPLNAAFILTPLAGLPDFLIRTPPETHIGYAVTWFGMAIAFVVIYALFHARAGRLRFGSGRPGKGRE